MKHLLNAAIGITLLVASASACSRWSTPGDKPDPIDPAARLTVTPGIGSDSSNLSKIDSHLQELVVAHLSGSSVQAASRASGIRINDREEVLLDIYVEGQVELAAAQLTSLGMRVQATNEGSRMVEGWLPVAQLLPAARLDTTKAIIAVTAFGTDQDSP